MAIDWREIYKEEIKMERKFVTPRKNKNVWSFSGRAMEFRKINWTLSSLGQSIQIIHFCFCNTALALPGLCYFVVVLKAQEFDDPGK